MAHKFPKYKFKADEPISCEEINYNLRQVKDEVSGRLNEHNIKENAFTDRSDAEYDFTLHVNNEVVSFDPALAGEYASGSLSSAAIGSYPEEYLIAPDPYTDDRVTLSNNSEWQTIIQYEKYTGNSLLWVLASFQQQLYEAGVGDSAAGQYAIRIDGVIVDETVTGGLDRANDPYGESTRCQAYPYVLDLILPVTPGYHLIELVGRVPMEGDYVQPPGDTYINIFNRELIILTLDPESEAVDGDTNNFAPLVEGDAITGAIMRAPFDSIKDDMNSLDYPAIQPESLTAVHVPTTVVNSGYLAMGQSVTSTYTNFYYRYDDDTINAVTGWQYIGDGTTTLFLDTITPIDLSSVTIAGILVGVDIHVTHIDSDPGANFFESYAIIGVQFRDEVGAWHTLGKTERYVNSEGEFAVVSYPVRKNIGLRTFITIDDIIPYSEVTGLAVVVAVINRDALFTHPVTVTLQQGSLWFAAVQAGS